MNSRLSFNRSFAVVLALIVVTRIVSAQEGDAFVIASPQAVAQLVLSNSEEPLVHTAAEMLAADVFSVSGQEPEISSAGNGRYQIRAGTLGVDAGFDKACKTVGIDMDLLRSKWEAYCIKTIALPDKNILLVVGSDPRGTAYGLMELSRLIGVSPWVWWADVLPAKRDTISLPSDFFLEDAPKVKFRGIFLNDEDWGLQPWAAKTFEPETGDIGPKTYEKIFELLLRLKANAIWPAMHDCTRAFFTYPDSIKMAKKYGIWVGSSHCEPMLRNNVDEWHRWSPQNGKRGAWNFDTNPDQITEYWKQRVEESADYDGIYTVGMRGIHDSGMPGGKTKDDKVRLLGRVLDTQRDLLSDILGKKASEIPQIFCPYKEVLELYRAGANIPDDVTLMWADDNHGYIRQLSTEKERRRSGGAGVYYHISYWGRPHDYLWLESTPVALIWEEMNKAYETNARRIWIVNVGDIKPNEIGMDFFLDMAWDPDRYASDSLDEYYSRFAEVQFGPDFAEEIGTVLKRYFQLGFSRKPEHMGWSTIYPNTKMRDPEFTETESLERIAAYDELEKQVEALSSKLPNELQDAFFELVTYKVIGASNMNKKILYAYLSRICAERGDIMANEYGKKSRTAYERIQEITATFNTGIAGAKWKYMMSYKPRDLPVFGMPDIGQVDPSQAAGDKAQQEEESDPCGVIALEAEHYTQSQPSKNVGWKMIQGLGRMSDAVGSFPVTAPPFNPGRLNDAPSLSYVFSSTESGEANLYFYCLPNLPINNDYRLRFAVGVDGGKPVIVDAALKKEMNEYNAEWQENVLRAAAIPSCKLTIPGKGEHTLKVTMIDPGVVLDKIEIVMGTRDPSYFGTSEVDGYSSEGAGAGQAP